MAKKKEQATDEVVVLENLVDETSVEETPQDPGNTTRAYRG